MSASGSMSDNMFFEELDLPNQVYVLWETSKSSLTSLHDLMSDLWSKVAELHQENGELQDENWKLRNHNGALEHQNRRLKQENDEKQERLDFAQCWIERDVRR